MLKKFHNIDKRDGAKTLFITTLIIMTFGITTLSTTAFSIIINKM
jgi:hypothetical protein